MDVATPLIFFVIVVSLFPLALGPGEETLQAIAPGVIWASALLSVMMSLESLFRADFDDGSLEQMLVTNEPLLLVIIGKIAAHWCASGLPLVVVSPVLGLMLGLTDETLLAVLLSLLLGTPVMSLVGAVGASLVVSSRKGGVLLAVLVLPLYVPVIILGASLVQTAQFQGETTGHFLWLGALLALSLALAPIAAAEGIRITASD